MRLCTPPESLLIHPTVLLTCRLCSPTHRLVSRLMCQLPEKSPWLNLIEPKWIHGKRTMWSSPRVCWAPTSWQIGSARRLDVHTTSICPLPKMPPDRALGL